MVYQSDAQFEKRGGASIARPTPWHIVLMNCIGVSLGGFLARIARLRLAR